MAAEAFGMPVSLMEGLARAHRLSGNDLRFILMVLTHSTARVKRYAVRSVWNQEPPSVTEWGQMLGWHKSQVCNVRRRLVDLGVLTAVDGDATRLAVNLKVDEWDASLFAIQKQRGQGRKPKAVPWQGNANAVIDRLISSGRLSGVFTERMPAEEWQTVRGFVFERDDHTCLYCGYHGTDLHCDHLIPLALGGTNHPDNLITACGPCNMAKGAKSPEEMELWLTERQATR